MNTDEATLLVGFISSVIVPFIVSYIKRVSWQDKYKVMLAMTISAIAGMLTTFATGELELIYQGRWVTTGLAIWGASTLFYHTAFKSLGLEQELNPDHKPEIVPKVSIDDDLRTP